MTSVLNKLLDTFKMGSIDEEERQYLQDVEAVKQWWTDSRWRYTKRPFTAEQIVQKRGTIKIQYPSNAQAKKLWKLIENRYAVSSLSVWPPLWSQTGSDMGFLPGRQKPPLPHMAASNPPCLPR